MSLKMVNEEWLHPVAEGTLKVDFNDIENYPVDSAKAILAKTKDGWKVCGLPGNGYTLVENTLIAEALHQVSEELGVDLVQCKYSHGHWSNQNNWKYFQRFKIVSEEIQANIDKDSVYNPVISINNSYDGKGSLRILSSCELGRVESVMYVERLVCSNGLRMMVKTNSLQEWIEADIREIREEFIKNHAVTNLKRRRHQGKIDLDEVKRCIEWSINSNELIGDFMTRVNSAKMENVKNTFLEMLETDDDREMYGEVREDDAYSFVNDVTFLATHVHNMPKRAEGHGTMAVEAILRNQ